MVIDDCKGEEECIAEVIISAFPVPLLEKFTPKLIKLVVNDVFKVLSLSKIRAKYEQLDHIPQRSSNLRKKSNSLNVSVSPL